MLTGNLVDANENSQVGVQHALDNVSKELQDEQEVLVLDSELGSVLAELEVFALYKELQILEEFILLDLVVVEHVFVPEQISIELDIFGEVLD